MRMESNSAILANSSENGCEDSVSRCFVHPFGANLGEVRALAHRIVDLTLAACAGAGLGRPVSRPSGLPISPHIPALPRAEKAILDDLQALIAASASPGNPD